MSLFLVFVQIVNKEKNMHYSPVPMHIPDGFLSLMISIICWLAAASVIGLAI